MAEISPAVAAADVDASTTTHGRHRPAPHDHPARRRCGSSRGRILIRRVKRVMGERAREVHPDLHPMTYFILTHLAANGPMRAPTWPTRSTWTRARSAVRCRPWSTSASSSASPTRTDGRAILLDATDEGRRRLDES